MNLNEGWPASLRSAQCWSERRFSVVGACGSATQGRIEVLSHSSQTRSVLVNFNRPVAPFAND